MAELEYRLIQDRQKKPLVTLESPLGNGQEIYPDTLRSLAAELTKIADEADARDMGKGYFPAIKQRSFDQGKRLEPSAKCGGCPREH